MTRRQKQIVIILTIVIALTRLLALAHGLFDWDEALFTLGVRDYDVPNHQPHPPGYPLFVAAAKGLYALGIAPFRALQIVVVVGAMLLFPALFFFARELGFDFATSVSGAALFAFLPNVWIYGGTGFSDVPATALVFLACALLLRGRRDPRAYLLGALVLGIAAGIRPMSLFAGAVPFVIGALGLRRLRTILAAMLITGTITAASYAGAALASHSVEGYRDALKSQSEWVRNVDSFRNPNRPKLHNAAKSFFLWPVQQRALMVGLAVLAIVGMWRGLQPAQDGLQRDGLRDGLKPVLHLLATFAPVALMSWLNLDIEAASRYAVAYLAVHALLAAAVLRGKYQFALAAMIIIVFILWTWPALQLQRTSDPPPVAAMQWVKRNVAPHELVYIHSGLGPIAETVLPRHHRVYYERPGDIELSAHHAWIVAFETKPGAHNFVWPRTSPMWKIVRRRNFEASVGRVSDIIVYGKGWHVDERRKRWTEGESVTSLPPLPPHGVLQLRMQVPEGVGQTVELRMNGVVVDRFVPVPEKRWVLPSRTTPNELRIISPAKLRIDALTWTPQR